MNGDDGINLTQEVSNIDESNIKSCKKCGLPIYEGHAYELGEDRWHINCFKCSKCGSSLGCNSNFLVLGNGNLICSNCSYNCKQCGKKIDDLAILTGDQAYCSSCFKCRSCKLKIEDLRYARTSIGLFCMNCHEKLIAKKKKHDLKKRQNALLQQQMEAEREMSDSQSVLEKYLPRIYDNQKYDLSNTSTPLSGYFANARSHLDLSEKPSNGSSSSLSLKDKDLPAPPDSLDLSRSVKMKPPSISEPPMSKHSATSSISNNDTANDSIEEINDSDDELTKKRALLAAMQDRKHLNEPQQVKTPPMSSSSKFDQTSISEPKRNDGRIELEFEIVPSLPAPKKDYLQPAPNLARQPSIGTSPSGEDQIDRPESPTSTISRANFQGKNLLILSPNNFNDRETFYSAGKKATSPTSSPSFNLSSAFNEEENSLSVLESQEELMKQRSGCPSPIGKVNRQARVLESNDYSLENTSGFSENTTQNSGGQYPENANRTPKKERKVSTSHMASPPPKLPLPVVPITPSKRDIPVDVMERDFSKSNYNRFDDGAPKGLGLAGIDLDETLNYKEQKRQYSISRSNGSEKQSSKGSSLTLGSRVIGNTTPTVTNLENEKSTPTEQERKSSLSRKSTLIRTPKLGLKHKRSISGGNGGLSGKLGFFKSSNNNKEEINIISGHTRHASDGTITNGGSAYVTPPLPLSSPTGHTSTFRDTPIYGRDHARSTSDTPYMSSADSNYSKDLYKHELDLRSMKMEIYRLESSKQSFFNENRKLATENQKLNDTLQTLRSKINSEGAKYDNLVSEIRDLERKKESIIQTNRELSEQNSRLEQSLNSRADASSLSLQKLSSNDQSSSTEQLTGGSVTNGINNVNHGSPSTNMGTPHSESYIQEEGNNDQKGNRLRFWRKPRQAVPGESNSIPVTQSKELLPSAGPPQSNSSQGQAYQSYLIRPPNSRGANLSTNNINGNLSPHQFNNSNMNGRNELPVNDGTNRKGKGTFMTKSRSTNILDSFLTSNHNNNNNANHSTPNVNSSANEGHVFKDNSLKENLTAPLFSSSIQKRAEYENEKVPLIITKCILEVENRGLDTEGIYRLSGGNSSIVAVENAFANLSPNPRNDEAQMKRLEESLNIDINAITSALKRYLRKLPEPIIPYTLYESYIKVVLAVPSSKADKRITDLKTKVINKLPPANKHALYLLCRHLDVVSSYSSVNRMSTKNLAVVFAPTIARDESGQKEMLDMGHRNDVTEILLVNYAKIFQNV